jgi:hypothetical protein
VQLPSIALSKPESLRSHAGGQVNIAIAWFHETPPRFRRRVPTSESLVGDRARIIRSCAAAFTLRKFLELDRLPDRLVVSPVAISMGWCVSYAHHRQSAACRSGVAAIPCRARDGRSSDVLVVPNALAKAYAPTFGLSHPPDANPPCRIGIWLRSRAHSRRGPAVAGD